MKQNMVSSTKARVLVVSADTFGPRVLPAVRHLLGDTGQARETGFPDDLDRAITDPGTGQVVVLVHDPVVSLALRLADQAAPQAMLRDWMNWAETLLQMQRRARQRITLVDVGVFATKASEGRAKLSQRLGVQVPDGLVAPGKRGTAPAGTLLAAFTLLAVSPGASDLAQELRALTLAPSAEPVGIDTVQAALVKAETATREETRLLREGLRLQGEIIDQLAAAKATNVYLTDRLADHEILLAEADSLARQLAESEAARRRQTAVLGAQILDDAERLAISEKRAAERSEELSRVYRSRSWRITRPLRGVRRPPRS